jgi:uncharacterized protein YegP (UPF0339 family)
MAAKYEIYKDKKGEFRFRLKVGAENILASEGYKSKASCQNGVASVQKNSPDAGQFEAKQGSNGKHYFVLKAANKQVIGTSQMYSSEAAMKNGIASVQKNGPTAAVEDISA